MREPVPLNRIGFFNSVYLCSPAGAGFALEKQSARADCPCKPA